ncbi:hypothetical protein CDO52_00705 [Nocardiopsis gilva YIM 90087]|uniref:Uncharacterized protein n=1 Tax=Nocardiopsis gilva YIM 90087 TaxID=1235441 RepID=A0A223S0E4_9ACTN|nr:hypothetical protein [Nocardiopsis gilva]ASU81499.1 hypothetical protein CDO52_00705 [Nocardiopsis gilva YIM 90087]
MARVWSCGFELRSPAEWDGTGGSPTISTDLARSGEASLRCSPTADVAYIQHQVAASDTSPWYVRAYLLVSTLPSVDVDVIQVVDQANAVTAGIRLTTAGTLQLLDGETQEGSDSSALTVGAWHRVELEVRSLGNGSSARLDGVEFATDGVISLGENSTSFRFGAITPCTVDLYLDDIAVNDDSGSDQTSWPGEGRIVHLRPDAAGDAHQWHNAINGTYHFGSEDSWQVVDDVPPDDIQTYAYWNATGQRHDEHAVDYDSAILSTDTITLIQVGARIGAHSFEGTRDLALRLKSPAGAVTVGTTVQARLDGWVTHDDSFPSVYSLTSYTSPDTAVAWTPTDLQSIQIGYGTVTEEALTRRVSAVWALVEYQAGTEAPPPAPNAEAIGVQGGLANLPALIAEASFTSAAQDPLALHLDDPDRGILGQNTLAGETAFSDVSQWVRSANTNRGADRVSSPIVTYDAGTASLVLDNRDRRFDPTHLAGPYVVGGRSQVTPMREMRLRARWGSTSNMVVNPSFEGASTDGWTSNNETSLAASTDVVPKFGTYALAITRTGSNAFEAHNCATQYPDGFEGGQVGDGDTVTISAYVYIPGETYDQVSDIAIVGGSGDLSGNAIDSTFVGKPSQADAWERVSLTGAINDGRVLYDAQVSIWTDGTIPAGTIVAYVDAVQCVAGSIPEDFKPNEKVYDLARGFADQWDVAWSDPNESTASVQFSDAFKVFGNRQLAEATSPVGGSEDSGARIVRILDAIEWPDGDRDIATGDTTLQETSFGSDALSLLRSVAETEIGELYVNAAGKVVFRNRGALYTETRSVHPKAIFGDRDPELRYREVIISSDDATLANEVRITREGGAEQVATDTESQSAYLTRTYSTSGLLVEDDTTAGHYAEFVLYQSSEPELRFEQLAIDPLRDPGRLMPLALGLEIGDRIRIRRRPPGGGSLIERDVFVRGVQHEIVPGSWRTVFSLQSATKGAFLVLDDPILGVLDENALGY